MMKFPVCITVDNSYVIAVIHYELTEYMVTADILRYETCEKLFLADGRPIKKVQVIKDVNNNRYFGISMLDVYSKLSREYQNEDTIILDVSSITLNFEDLATCVLENNEIVSDIDALYDCIKYLSEEIAEEVKYIASHNKPLLPLISSSKKNIIFVDAEDLDLKVNTKPVVTMFPDDELYLPLPTTADIVRANKVDFKDGDALISIPQTSEFGSENQREEYIDNIVRQSSEDLVVSNIYAYINPWYHLEKIFAEANIPEQERILRIELAKQCDSSIYRQNNLRVLGVQVEPSSNNYKLLFGKGDYNTDFYSNELRFKEALENLLNSVLLYENEAYSMNQLIRKKAGPVRSDWFDNWALEQIKIILQYAYAYTGKVAPSVTNDDDDEDEDVSDNKADLTVSNGVQLLKIAKNELNRFVIVSPDELEYTQKVRNHELEVDTGFQNCKWYLNGVNNPQSCIYALIQLLRLGEHKCQYVRVPSIGEDATDTPYFDTKLLRQVKTITIERAFEVVPTPLGKEYSILGGVYITRKLDNASVDLPVGIVLGKEETNGIISRVHKVVLDTNKFINDVISLRKDKTPVLSIDGFDFIDDCLTYDESMLEESLNQRFSPYELEIASHSDDGSIIETRMSKAQYDKLTMYCREAGIPVPTIVDNKFTMLLSLAKVETGELLYSQSEKISLQSDAREDYVLQKLAKMYLDNIIKNQSQMEISKLKVSLVTLLNYILKKNEDTDAIATEGKSIFDTMLTDRTKYDFVNSIYIMNKSGEVIGYAYQVANKKKEMTLLVTSKREIGLRLVTSSDRYKKLPVAKVLSMSSIDKFYDNTNSEEQMDIVLKKHRVALDSINTVRLLKEDA